MSKNKNIQCDGPGFYHLTATREDKISKYRDACCREVFLTKMLPLAAKLVAKGWRVELACSNRRNGPVTYRQILEG